MTTDLTKVIDRVAGYSADMNVEGEDRQLAVAVNGLFATGREYDTAHHLLKRAVATQTSEGLFAYGWGDYPKEWA